MVNMYKVLRQCLVNSNVMGVLDIITIKKIAKCLLSHYKVKLGWMHIHKVLKWDLTVIVETRSGFGFHGEGLGN